MSNFKKSPGEISGRNLINNNEVYSSAPSQLTKISATF